jgi:hypothetical protein
VTGRVDDLGTEQGCHLAALVGHVVGHDEGHSVAFPAADHGQRDAGVAGGGLEDDRVLLQRVPPLEVLDEVFRDPVLDRTCRIEHLELAEDPDGRLWGHPGDLDQRRVADRVEDVLVGAAMP